MKRGLIQQLPNLYKQETVSFGLYVGVLFELYKHDPMNDDETITKELMKESIECLQRITYLLKDQNKNIKDVNVWTSVICSIFKELQLIFLKRDDRFERMNG